MLLASTATVADAGSPTGVSDEARSFGMRDDVSDASISPDGARIAFVQTQGARGRRVVVYELNGGPEKTILSSDGGKDRISDCGWATSRRLLCTIILVDHTGVATVFSRMVALDADGANMRMLSARTGASALELNQNGGAVIDWLADGDDTDAGASVLMTRQIVPEATTGTIVAETRSGLAVERVDTLTLRRSPVEPPRSRSAEFITDGHGTVRVSGSRSVGNTGYDGDQITYSYRKSGERTWLPLSTVTFSGGVSSGFEPYAVDRDLNVAYGFDGRDGRRALYRVSLDGTLRRELVYAHPDVDVDDLIQIGRQHRVVGVSFATDRRQSVFFDPELKVLAASLGRAIPKLPIVSFVDATADERKLLVFARSDTDPGRYYLYDRDTRKLGELLPSRPALAAVTGAPVQAVQYPAGDGTVVPGYLTLPLGSSGKGLPAIVMPHGGPGARDEWGFDWLAQFFAHKGYAVLQPNFRGSTGYGNSWFQKNGFQSWRTAVGDVNDAGRWLVAQGIAAPDTLAIVGWSYGGYAALQSAVLDPALFKAIVAIAPVTDLETLRSEARNYTNYAVTDAYIGRGPHIREGSPAQNVDSIRAPVLLFHGDRDLNVGVGESRMMASRLRAAGKAVEYVEFERLDHQLADDEVRADMLDRADVFIRRAFAK